MFQIAICEDVAEERKQLLSALSGYARFAVDAPRITQYENCEALVGALERGAGFDLLFLDIFMDLLNGMEAARLIRKMGRNVPIIFLTASPDFALESYAVHASGYLLKPLVPQELYDLLDYLLEKQPASQKIISFHHEEGVAVLPCDAILYAESRGNWLFVNDRRDIVFRTRKKLDEFEKLLDDPRFLRCHQSYLVNMDYIALAEDDFVLAKGGIIPIRVRARKEIKERYFEYLFERTLNH